MEKKSVYIETSVISYLTARPSKNLIVAAWQSETITWWEQRRECFALCISPVVVEEIREGDSLAAERRLASVAGIPLLEMRDEIYVLAEALIQPSGIPRKAFDDALHISVGAFYGIDFLLTWNCRHMDNAEIKPLVRAICETFGYKCPEICTPSELMGVPSDA